MRALIALTITCLLVSAVVPAPVAAQVPTTGTRTMRFQPTRPAIAQGAILPGQPWIPMPGPYGPVIVRIRPIPVRPMTTMTKEEKTFLKWLMIGMVTSAVVGRVAHFPFK